MIDIKKRILIVEDEFIIAKTYEIYLKKNGFELTGIESSGMSAIEAVTTDNPDIVLMDIFLKGEMTGIQAAKIITEREKLQIVFISGNSDEKTVLEALAIKGSKFLKKPLNMNELFLILNEPF